MSYIKSEEFSDINGYDDSTAFLNYRNRQCKLVAKKNISKGDLFSQENLCLKLIDTDHKNTKSNINELQGQKAAKKTQIVMAKFATFTPIFAPTVKKE